MDVVARAMRRAVAYAISKELELAYCCRQTGTDERNASFRVAVTGLAMFWPNGCTDVPR